MKKIKSDKNQIIIYRYIRNEKGHLVISALAGCGKTHTIVSSVSEIKERYNKKVIFLAFNKSTEQELLSKLDGDIEVKTTHKFGFGRIRSKYYNVEFDKTGKKYLNLAFEHIKPQIKHIPHKEQYNYLKRVEGLVELGRSHLTSDYEQLASLALEHDLAPRNGEIGHAQTLMHIANSSRETVDFTDMIYWPAKDELYEQKYDYVYIDESQDLNPAQHHMVKSILAPNGRLIAVGDRNQAIYGWRGASVDSFDQLSDFAGKVLPLSKSFRNSKAVIKYAQRIVPAIEAWEDAVEGEVNRVSGFPYEEVENGDFILCRTNQPLTAVYFALLKKGRKVKIKGKDISKKLLNIVKFSGTTYVYQLKEYLDQYMEKEVIKLVTLSQSKSKFEASVIFLDDKINSIKTIASNFTSTQEVVRQIEDMFDDSVGDWISLSSVHKAKGLEADNVFIIRPDLMPHPRSVGSALNQEKNLEYVAITRARNRLFIVDE